MAERDAGPDGPKDVIDAAAGSNARRRRDARRISRDERNMHAVLPGMAGQPGAGLPAVSPEPATPLERRRPWRRWTVGPLAAAAVLSALLLLPDGAIEEVNGPLASPARSMVTEMDVDADRPFVVFPTNDPDIAVVWLLSPEESD